MKTNVAPARYPAVTAKNLGKMCENLSSWAMAFSDDSDDMDDKGYMSSYMNVSQMSPVEAQKRSNMHKEQV